MSGLKEEPSFDIEQMEKWLETYFLDPLTTYLDETTFRVDIFETDLEFIIEALLPDFNPKHISVYLCNNKIQIQTYKKGIGKKEYKKRTIDFPFSVIEKYVHAHYSEGILEVYISKEIPGSGKNHFVRFN
ncbi:Hsp20/alpha crystallin family protein [Bacillus sp. 31A1R]|uniref:Hsp20/alpha crystallin family protein n=1 Tax=Robertmurraya mangrovi TaxID=3098077 RepID=A0ABU5J075_9BACI|nr:Hsp20/alpha crystallin family protein [Bacillus sp. 31A1R]MDZ5472757.1 Hsp20/alpha crystallin family protein [Bacillus sp. 31A1R]